MKHTHEELRAICDAATDGEWLLPAEYDDWGVMRSSIKGADGYYPMVCQARAGGDYNANEHRKNNTDPSYHNARFIAATDPPTVRALLDEIERLKCECGIETQLTLGERKKLIGDIFKDGWTVQDLSRCEAFYNSVQRHLRERKDDE